MTMIIYAMSTDQPEAKAIFELLKWQYKNPVLFENVGVCLTKSRGHGVPVVGICTDDGEEFVVGYSAVLDWLDEKGAWLC